MTRTKLIAAYSVIAVLASVYMAQVVQELDGVDIIRSVIRAGLISAGVGLGLWLYRKRKR